MVVIGGGVAGYVAAIKAAQEGLKVRLGRNPNISENYLTNPIRSPALRNAALSAEHV